MPETVNPFFDYVFSLSEAQFNSLKEAVDRRIDKQLYHVTTLEDAALAYGRKPVCPNCGSELYHHDGYTASFKRRYQCNACNTRFTLLSDSIFNSAKLSIHKLIKYIGLMSFNVPLELMCETLDISQNTAQLWRSKIFNTVNSYQDHLYLHGRVWIDETYIEDYEVLAIKNNKHLRGLSRSKICIVVAIDQSKNMLAVVSGHGKPSSKRITDALKGHILPGSLIVHDGDHSHYKLIKELNCEEEVYKANKRDAEYLEKMELINNMCSWLKRYLFRFTSMRIENLQSYLNWFIYLQRVKKYSERWPKTERILRHLLLDESRFTRKY